MQVPRSAQVPRLMLGVGRIARDTRSTIVETTRDPRRGMPSTACRPVEALFVAGASGRARLGPFGTMKGTRARSGTDKRVEKRQG